MAPRANFSHVTSSSSSQRQADEEWGRAYMARKEATRNYRHDRGSSSILDESQFFSLESGRHNRGIGSLLTEDTLASLKRALPREVPGTDSIQRTFPLMLSREMASAATTQDKFVEANGAMIERALNASLMERFGPEPTKEQVARGYQIAMKSIHGYEPTMADVVGLAIDEALEFDAGKKACSRRMLDRFCCRYRGPVERTMVGSSGAKGGFGLAVQFANNIFDRARQTDGPWARCNWEPVANRTFWLPVVSETSRARGSRYGGITSAWGLPEVNLPAASDGAIAGIELTQNRLLVYTTISRDLFRDAAMISRWLDYVAISEFRAAIEAAMILGPATGSEVGQASPQGVIKAGSTVTVAKDNNQTQATITATNISGMWSSIAPACAENAVWHARKATITAIDALAVSGAFPVNIYLPQGVGGNKHSLIYGRPLIPCEFCPAIGQPGDLICVDWGEYILTYMQKNPVQSPLAFEVVLTDSGHRGILGMPEGAVQSYASEHFHWSTDVIDFVWKMRCAGNFVWNGTSTDYAGGTIGPAAIIALRA